MRKMRTFGLTALLTALGATEGPDGIQVIEADVVVNDDSSTPLRSTAYDTTPRLSADAFHESSTSAGAPLATVRPFGAVGACVSGPLSTVRASGAVRTDWFPAASRATT